MARLEGEVLGVRSALPLLEVRALTWKRLGAQTLSLGRPLEGGLVAGRSLPMVRGSALGHGCCRGGRVVLPLARAAAVSTRLRVLVKHRKP